MKRNRLIVSAIFLSLTWGAGPGTGQERRDILHLLQLEPSDESLHYINDQKEFQLHTLLTEQRHRLTWDISARIKTDTLAGLRLLFAVDEDISARMAEIARRPQLIERGVQAVVRALRHNRRIYLYGCGATGRLAKQMESAIWRPFWKKLKSGGLWPKLAGLVAENIEDSLIGEMTGADRALISSLEGFEDLQLIGRLQLQEHGIGKGDAVFCISEGGETSSVIGTILAAAERYGTDVSCARRNLFFIYNNPDSLLRPFGRCRAVLDNAAISRINLATGPQAIAGSTRMQAASSETFVMGVILEEAISRLLGERLTPAQVQELGFSRTSLSSRLLGFQPLQQQVAASAGRLAALTDLEAETYRRHRFSTYFADRGLIPVFIDSTERSPTFRLLPLDTVSEPQRRCWIQVWTPADNGAQAWLRFLGRPFHGLDPAFFRPHFENEIRDPYLRQAALRSLAKAGNDQQVLYDFAFADFNLRQRAPQTGDLGVLVLCGDETDQGADPASPIFHWLRFVEEKGARLGIISVTPKTAEEIRQWVAAAGNFANAPIVSLVGSGTNDPLGLRQQLALKLVLNAHSTALMAKLGRLIGNTMTFVSPSNLKLIGRATFLIQSHVNETLSDRRWQEVRACCRPLSYAEANALLFSAKEFVKNREDAEAAEVALAIIRALEALKRQAFVSWEEALVILKTQGLSDYLSALNSPWPDREVP